MRFLIRSHALAPASSGTRPRARHWRGLKRHLAAAGLWLLPVAALGGGGLWLERSGALAAMGRGLHAQMAEATRALGLAVTSVEVEGRHRASREAILEALGVERGTAILDVDLTAAKARLEALPWVKQASVARRLPNTIYVRLVEREPLALWQMNQVQMLVDREGVVVPGVELDRFGSLVELVGEGAPEKGSALLAMLDSEPDLAAEVVYAVRVGGRRWNLEFESGLDVALPELDPDAAWHRLAALQRKERLLDRDVALIDLRLPDRIVVRTSAAGPVALPARKPRHPGRHA